MIISVIYFCIFFFIFLVVLVLQTVNRKKAPNPATETPLISILIAVRNEEHSIIRCLEAIRNLTYPADKIEVLIGDDASTDNTRAVIQTYIQNKRHYYCLPITENIGKARGKGNVLAHLTRKASSDFYFITDADIAVPPNWIQHMLGGLQPKTGIVTGMTTITGPGLFAHMQAIDWLNALGLMQIVSDLNLPVTTMGNNMLITRQAYEATGGYENMTFSVTEDVQLFKAVIKRGYKSLNIFDKGVLAWSTPVRDLKTLLHQRKRWMQGVWHLPWYMVVILVVYASFYAFCLPFPLYYSWSVAVAIFFGKLFLQTLFIYKCLKRLKLHYPIWYLFFFEFYVIFVSVMTIVFFLLPFKMRWKNRKY